MPDTETPLADPSDQTPPTDATAAAPAAAPAVDLAAELAAIREQMRVRDEASQQQLAMLRDGFTMLASQQAQPRATATPDITDEQIEQLVAEGKTAQAMRLVADRTAAQTAERLKREAIDPLAGQMQTGVNSLSAIAFEQARASMPDYDKYKSEVDAALASMDPQLRIIPANQKMAYAIVVGQHVEEIKREAYERGVRSARENPASQPTTAGRMLGSDGEEIPTAAELYRQGVLDQQSVKMIKAAGGEDAFVQKYFPGKYDGKWSVYSKMIVTPDEGNA